MLLGRRSECMVFDGLLVGARGGGSGAVVVVGEAGIGKSALLQYAVEAASDFRVIRALGTESEMELAFSALHQLCVPLLDRLERLPGAQRNALEVTFGLSADAVPDRFFVGLAMLSLVAEAAEGMPLLCVVDDAQWLDRASAQVLGFVARRLLAEAVVMVFAARDSSDELKGVPELTVEGLGESDARDLLARVVRSPLDERVREQILAETRGNPLALLELSHGRSAVRLAGGFGFPGSVPLSGRIEENFRCRFEALPEDTRRLLMVAAAEPVGDPALLWRAAQGLGIGRSALEPAQAAGLIDVGHRVRFRHSLVRSAIYQTAPPEVRREAHRALAEASDPELDRDRRAWHLAEATVGLDEGVAAELELAAGRAQARGGVAAAAAFLERSVGLTGDPARRARRALAAARAKHLAGAPDAALGLVVMAEAGGLDELGLARVDMLRAQIAYAQNRGRDAPPLLLRAAKRLEPLDVKLARSTYLEGLAAAFYLGRLASSAGVVEVAHAVLAAPKPDPPRVPDLLLDGMATRFTEGYAASAPMLKRALAALPSEDTSSEEALRWLWLAIQAAASLWNDRMWEVVATRYVQLARHTGVLPVLPLALNWRIVAHILAGELDAADALVQEAWAVSEATGSHVPPYGALLLVAWRGRETDTSTLIERTMTEVLARGEAYALSASQWAHAVLYNGLGRYQDALAAAERATEHPEDLSSYNWGLVELIVAAVRSGKPELAANALGRLSEITRASGTEWALGIEARSRAMLSAGAAAESLYREGIDRLQRTRVRVELARTHLLYGEWLRRERRRLDARKQLRTAHAMFTTMGAEAFAARAERELLATGESVRTRVPQTREDLTAQETQIARLAREGLSNQEIGALVHQPQNGRVPPPQGFQQAGHHLAPRTPPRARDRTNRCLKASTYGVPPSSNHRVRPRVVL